jgi:dolichol-phosphate mannosyltransferase
MKGKNIKISIIIPVMNESGNIDIIVKKISNELKENFDWELIFINDGSVDDTLERIKRNAQRYNRIKYISFSRNFGHQNALRAGYDYASGDCVICMDGDMQHPPKLIFQMIKKWNDGYDIVYTIRKDSEEISFFKRITAKIFYKIMNIFSDVKIDPGAADFRLVDKQVVDVIKSIKENDLFMRGMISWLGFRQCGIEYEPEKRVWGNTKYTFRKMVQFAISGITSFSVKPLHIATVVGYAMAFIAFIYALYAIYIKIFTDTTIEGWTSVLVIVLLIGGIQLIMIGILGSYMGKLFMESKKRPNYIIKEKKV